MHTSTIAHALAGIDSLGPGVRPRRPRCATRMWSPRRRTRRQATSRALLMAAALTPAPSPALLHHPYGCRYTWLLHNRLFQKLLPPYPSTRPLPPLQQFIRAACMPLRLLAWWLLQATLLLHYRLPPHLWPRARADHQLLGLPFSHQCDPDPVHPCPPQHSSRAAHEAGRAHSAHSHHPWTPGGPVDTLHVVTRACMQTASTMP